MTQHEEWKTVSGESHYQVSNLGNVRSLLVKKGSPPKILKQGTCHDGYLYVELRGNGFRKRCAVHRLVAAAFLGPSPAPKMDVAHWDNNPLNNEASNLRWATRTENNRDKQRHGTQPQGEEHVDSKLTTAQVLEIVKRCRNGEMQKDVAKDYGISKQHVGSLCRGERWKHLLRPAAAAVAMLIGTVAGAAQTSDEPWLAEAPRIKNRDEVMAWRLSIVNAENIFPRIEPLQLLLDNPELTTIDLGGQTIDVQNVILSIAHSGKRICNGKLHLLPNAQIGNLKICQNVSHNGIFYPAGIVNFYLGQPLPKGEYDLEIYGDFSFLCELQEHNELVALNTGWGANGFTVKTTKAGAVFCENVYWHHLGNSGIAGSFDQLVIRNNKFEQVAKHGIGARSIPTGSTVVIEDNEFVNCGNAWDLHGDAFRYDVPDTAKINRNVVINPRGHTKSSGQNWLIEEMFENRFEQTEFPCMNLWPAWDMARTPRGANIKWLTSIGFPVGGIWTRNDGASGPIGIQHALVRDSLPMMMVQSGPITLTDSEAIGAYTLFRSSVPYSWNNVPSTSPRSALEWAQIYDTIERKYDAFNALHGTNYNPSYWVPNKVLDEMETR